MTDTTSFGATRLWDLPRVGGASASDDGSVVVVPVTTHTTGEGPSTALHRVEQDGSTPSLALGSGSCADPAVSPGGERIAFVREVDGRRQAHVAPVGGGRPRRVTSVPDGVLGSPAWVDDDRLLVVTTLWSADPSLEATATWVRRIEEGPPVHATERRLNRVWDTWYEDDATQHVLLVDVRDEDPVPVDLTPGAWLLPDPLDDPGRHVAVSPDRRLLGFTTAAAAGDDDGIPVPHLRVVPLEGGEVVDLTPDATGPVGPPAFLPDGRILVTIAQERDFYAARRDLWAIDPASGQRELALGDARLGLDDVSVDADGRVVVGTTIGGRGSLVEVVDGTARRLAKDAAGSLGRPVATTGGLFAVGSSLVEPPELVRVDDQRVTTLTSFARPLVTGLDLGRREERVVDGARGDDVQVLLLHPPAAAVDDDRPPPLVHLVHGGPHGVFGDEWHWRWNAALFASEGWVTAMVNFHGSTGVDHEFTRSIHGDWPSMPTRDVLRVTDHLVEDGVVDGRRLAIAGGSYGGYLVTWLCTETDRFAAAVAHAAVTDVTGMWASDWPAALTGAFGGRPWDDPSVLDRSPSSRYGRIDTPMLVIHGLQDLRVPIDQGRMLYGALRERGVETRLVVFPDEGHWVVDRAASERWYAEVVEWLHRHLDRAG